MVLTKAENIAGYEKFTLDEVIYPDEDKKEEETVRNQRSYQHLKEFTMYQNEKKCSVEQKKCVAVNLVMCAYQKVGYEYRRITNGRIRIGLDNLKSKIVGFGEKVGYFLRIPRNLS